jgi:hypothetical protein
VFVFVDQLKQVVRTHKVVWQRALGSGELQWNDASPLNLNPFAYRRRKDVLIFVWRKSEKGS